MLFEPGAPKVAPSRDHRPVKERSHDDEPHVTEIELSARENVTNRQGQHRLDLVRSGTNPIAMTIAVLVALIGLVGCGGGDDSADGETPAPAPAPTTTTWRQATADDPLKVLVVGDSLVGWIPQALQEATTGQPVEVIDAWKGSSGLARPDFYDWPAELARLAAEHDPDVVVVGFGGNDTQSLVTEDAVIHRGDPAWAVEYERRVGQVLDAAEGPGRSLWWIGLPLSERSNVEEIRPAIEGAVTNQVGGRAWSHFVDAAKVLSPDGRYHVTLPGPDGTEVRVRADDGIHLSPTGGRMVVDSFIDEIRSERGFG